MRARLEAGEIIPRAAVAPGDDDELRDVAAVPREADMKADRRQITQTCNIGLT